MLNRFTLLSAAFCLLIFAACKKSNSGGNPSDPLVGNWTFTGETSNAHVTASESLGPVSLELVDPIVFRTINNTGTFTFTSDSLDAAGIGYTVDTTYTSYLYTGATVDSTTDTLNVTQPPTSSNVTYQLVGTDSINFPSGSPFALKIDSGQQTIQINGAHFTISGSTLTLTSTLTQTVNEMLDGVSIPTTAQVSSVITLTKQ